MTRQSKTTKTPTRKIRAREVRVGMTIPGSGVVASALPSAYGRVVRFVEGSPAVQTVFRGSDWVEVNR